MDNELIRRIVEFVEEASPIIWASVQRQVMVSAAVNLFWAAVLLIVGIGALYFTVRCFKYYKEDIYSNSDWSLWGLISATASGLFFLLFGFCLIDGLSILVNPDYYAIKGLIDLFPGG